MFEPLMVLAQSNPGPALADLFSTLSSIWWGAIFFAGFSLIIFVHELGHFIAAKLSRVKVDRFAIGFGRALFAYRKGVGLTWGPTQPALRRRVRAYLEENNPGGIDPDAELSDAQVSEVSEALHIGETEYCFNVLPLGGYVKMLGQEDFAVDKSGEVLMKADPRAFTHKPIAVRMFIVSAGVFMNLVFAAATFAVVFMVGWETIPAEVGQIQPGMPADQVGLRVGDKIVRVNSQAIADQADLQTAIVLASPDEPLELTYERKDRATGTWKRETVSISPEMSPENNVLRIGVAPPSSNDVRLALNDPATPKDQRLEPGDEIVAVNGKPTNSYWQIQAILADLKGAWGTLTVERPEAPTSQPEEVKAKRNEAKKTLQIPWRAREFVMPTGKADEESGHLLGFVPRQRVRQVVPGDRADLAGIKDGDIIARWGGQIAPRQDEIIASRRENPDREIRVTVYRRDEGDKTLSLTPKGSGPLGRGVPADGIIWGSQENDRLVIADIVTHVTDTIETPAAALKDVMPRGSLLTKVNDEPVKTWPELTQRFVKYAGTTVKLTWQSPGAGEQSGKITIPQTIGACKATDASGKLIDFVLPGTRQIISINGIARRELDVNGRRMSLSVDYWRAASQVLGESVGQNVKVVYEDWLNHDRHEVTVHVTPEMKDTWVLRTIYTLDDIDCWPRSTILRETNPLKASLIGLNKTISFIKQVYLVMQRMIFTRTMSVEQVSGPVGIVQVGSQVAAAGTMRLMYFLAFLSANIAVINFLPLPIMDGGVFMFLLIEKIKGSPLSVRVQVATQLIGLVLIIGIFLFVTLQDVLKMWG